MSDKLSEAIEEIRQNERARWLNLAVRLANLNFSVRPDGAFHQWREDPPRQLLV
jgi:hypothetical protein